MKKYLTLIIICMLIFSWDFVYYYNGSLYLPNDEDVEIFTKVEDQKLWLDKGDGFQVFDMKGVNLGLGMPGKFATEYSITKEEYLRWFMQIQELGANVIRTYTIAHAEFYEAFYEYNHGNPNPLYLIHGVWVDEYLQNSHKNAFDEEFYDDFLKSCKDVVDVINGRHKQSNLYLAGAQTYKKDISPWVYGYIIGVEWEGDLVSFTNETGPQWEQFSGDYVYTKDANNFEIFLAMIGNEMITYETHKYGNQRTLAFSNWPTTDPFRYPENVALEFEKFGMIDTEHIKTGEKFLAGQYASYHVYPYFPEYMHFIDDTIENTYLAYLKKLVDHHEMPVIISEFGIPSSRGMSSYEQNRELGRDQGGMSEKEQGEAIVSLYEDVLDSGCAGGIVFVWHDEWFKRTWNTVPFVDLDFSAFWSDYQTNEQTFGLLSFDPGNGKSKCYVDGDMSEWTDDDQVVHEDEFKLSMKYDERYMYFLAQKENFDFTQDKMYIPIDLTPKSGSNYIEHNRIETTHPTDFLIEIDREYNSRVLVQERYYGTEAIYGDSIKKDYNPYENAPSTDSSRFVKINMVVHELDYFRNDISIPFSEFSFLDASQYSALLRTYETGKLTYGNANPNSKDFNSLADFSFGEGFVEIKIPWGLLNFSDPSEMKIHDDYYENYGVEFLKVDHMNVGIGDGSSEIQMNKFELKKLGRKPKYHERLKKSYYILQEHWREN